jgi:hypothetical protein
VLLNAAIEKVKSLFYPVNLPISVMSHPNKMNELLEAKLKRDQKVREAEDEYTVTAKKFKLNESALSDIN